MPRFQHSTFILVDPLSGGLVGRAPATNNLHPVEEREAPSGRFEILAAGGSICL
jgi:hypothetical protein